MDGRGWGGGVVVGDFLQRPEGKKEGKRDAAAKEKRAHAEMEELRRVPGLAAAEWERSGGCSG